MNYTTEKRLHKQLRAQLSTLSAEQFAARFEQAKEELRQRSLLLTERQYADMFELHRELKRGDAARFVGETRLEPLSDGRFVPRPHGQEGFVASAERTANGLRLVFRPHAPKTADAIDVDVVELVTSDWRLLERIAESS